jgi:DNA repair ATPase RecN
MPIRNLRKHLSKARFRINVPFIGLEVPFDEIFNSKNIDQRISRLGEIKRDLQGAIEAVESLHTEALERKDEVDHLQQTVQKLEQDKSTVETALKLPEESFARLIARASAKSRIRGIIEGIIIGFFTGALSSLLIWYLTKSH